MSNTPAHRWPLAILGRKNFCIQIPPILISGMLPNQNANMNMAPVAADPVAAAPSKKP
jgi:hypothetical protein